MFTLTSTGYTSPSWKVLICPSGRSPLGKSDSSTNSGSVSNSSRESVKCVPLREKQSLAHRYTLHDWRVKVSAPPYRKSSVMCSSPPTSGQPSAWYGTRKKMRNWTKRTPKSIQRRAARLLHLRNDTRRSPSCSHDVRERLERT